MYGVFTTAYSDDFAEISEQPLAKKLRQSLLPFTAVPANRG